MKFDPKNTLYVLAVSGFALALTGCGEDLVENPLIQEQQKIVARLDHETKSISRQVDDMSLSFSEIEEDVRQVRNSPTGSSQEVEDLKMQVSELKSQVRELTMRQASVETKLKSGGVPARVADNSGSSVRGADSPKTTVVSNQSKPAPAPKPVRKAEPRPQPKGRYYSVKQGDTPKDIATANNISVDKLLEANNIKTREGITFRVGQRLFVPNS